MELAVQISSYEDLERLIGESGKEYDPVRIRQAYVLAEEKHRPQKRSSGEPYIIHPLSVAAILVGLGMDTESVMAGLLHDVVEDTDCTVEELTSMFGKEVALLVDGVTKLGKIPYSSREEQQAENLRKMLMAMAEDIRVIIIKFADRMHNLATLEYVSPQKQRDKALECLEVYAPIAHRLGIRTVKEFMEDVSLKYLDPQAYHEIEEDLASRVSGSKEFLRSTQEQIRSRLSPVVPDVYIEGRVKSVYGIYRKMFIQGKSFEEIYDVFAIRVIVDTIADCFNVLGIVHDMFQPLPGRFKDYISMPKPNMYQSLHTTVLTKAGVPFEVQIRTWEMHHTAEYGIAAHWKYKLGMSAKESDNSALDERLSWIRQMLENQKDSEDVTDLVHSIKSDLIPEEVFVFTPKGDVVNLPLGSTVIDFAYAIHSAVGNRMIGAKVDKRIVPLDYKVKTGEIIEILTTKEAGKGPNRDWLTLVRTSEARNKIRAWFKKEKRDENIVEGKAELEREFRRSGMTMVPGLMDYMLESVGKRHNCSTEDDFYAAIGYGGIQLWKVLPRIREEYQRLTKGAEPQELPPPCPGGRPPEQGDQRRAGGGHGQLPGQALPVLQPPARGRDRGLYHPGLWGVHPQAQLLQRPQGPDPVPRAGAVGPGPLGGRREGRLQVHPAHCGGGPGGAAGRRDPAALRHEDQHPRPQFPAGAQQPERVYLRHHLHQRAAPAAEYHRAAPEDPGGHFHRPDLSPERRHYGIDPARPEVPL